VTRRLLEEGIGPGTDVIMEEAKTQLYAREVWQLMRSELASDMLGSLIDAPDKRLGSKALDPSLRTGEDISDTSQVGDNPLFLLNNSD